MTDSIDQIAVGVRVLLRGVSDIKLPQPDLIEQINDNLRGKMQDMQLGGRERQTRVVEAQIVDAGIDFTVKASGNTDGEAEKLEFGGNLNAHTVAWQEARIVPLQAYARAFDQGGVVAAFYGQNKVKLNLTCAEVSRYCWRLTFRQPLLAIISSGAPFPLPGDFVPMIKKEVAVACMPIVQDDTDSWIAWMERTEPKYRDEILAWNNPGDRERPGRWQKYLMQSNEPQIQQVRPFNNARRTLNGRTSGRAYLPRTGN